MFSDKQVSELRGYLENTSNPLFFYDNDVDGLCSFLLMRKFLGRGKGVAVKTHPEIDGRYAKKVIELGADMVFVLDRPFLGDDFVNEIEKMNIKIVWIDHHDVVSKHHNHPNVFTFNPGLGNISEVNEPVTSFVYKITKRKEDLWIAIMGCVADHYLPDFKHEFEREHPELWSRSIKKPFDAYYNSEIGLLARALSFGLKDSVSHVVYLQNFLINCGSPRELFEELESNSSFGRKYCEIKQKYGELLEKAKNCVGERMIFFKYGGVLSISSDLANELSYIYPDKYIMVAYANGAMSNLSIRGKNVRKIIEDNISDFEGASGGGHKDAVGARVRTEDLEKFKNVFEKEINN